MRFDREMLRLYAVTDRSWPRGRMLLEQVEDALHGGEFFGTFNKLDARPI